MDSIPYLIAIAVMVWAYLLLNETNREQQVNKENEAMIAAAEEIKEGISNSIHKAEIDFWVNEIACLRNEYGKLQYSKIICQQLYAHAMNQCARLQLTTFSL